MVNRSVPTAEEMLSFYVKGQPQPYQRPGGGKSGKRFTEKETAAAISAIMTAAGKAMNLAGWPAASSRRVKNKFELRGPRGEFHLSLCFSCAAGKPRGDIDNLAKTVLDALTKACVWWDDKMCTRIAAEIFETDGEPGTVIIVTRREEA